ncbi:MAG: hypothetical protein LBE36_06440 [Flavobacteriaceae bacterium]|nr:hypothetical protein [Flavobacteriaceae bacterium]
MEQFNNKSETFFREIRKIEIYKSETVQYIDNYNGVFPNSNTALYVFDVVPDSFSREIKRKKTADNYYHEINIEFPLLKIDTANVGKYQSYFNDKKFAVILISNTEKTLLGNHREPLTIEIFDEKTDDNSGNDKYILSITGETIINPKLQNL